MEPADLPGSLGDLLGARGRDAGVTKMGPKLTHSSRLEIKKSRPFCPTDWRLPLPRDGLLVGRASATSVHDAVAPWQGFPHSPQTPSPGETAAPRGGSGRGELVTWAAAGPGADRPGLFGAGPCLCSSAAAARLPWRQSVRPVALNRTVSATRLFGATNNKRL